MPTASLPVLRLNAGKPILAPTLNWWETGVTFNAAATYLPPTPRNAEVIRALLPMLPPDSPDLAEGVVAIHYRARPEVDPGSSFARSFIGLALFTPDLRPLYRYQEPVLYPSPDPDDFDALGVEDPRITCVDGLYVMIYCGVRRDAQNGWAASLCMALSDDLLHWDKLGPLEGDVNRTNNKDGVLFPETFDGKYYLLHRPFGPGLPSAIHLACADQLTGPFTDLGELLRAFPNPSMQASWVGAGSQPIPLDDQRWAFLYHTGNIIRGEDREYDLDAGLLDLRRLQPGNPAAVVTGRIEHLMVPETPAELRSHSALQVGNVLFACGHYEYGGNIIIIYGGADTYTLAASVNKAECCQALERAGLENPFL